VWQKEKSGQLYVGNISDFPAGLKSISTFNDLDNKPEVEVVSK